MLKPGIHKRLWSIDKEQYEYCNVKLDMVSDCDIKTLKTSPYVIVVMSTLVERAVISFIKSI